MLTKKGSGEGSEWKIPSPGSDDNPYDTRTAAQRDRDMQAYMQKYGIKKIADEGWESERKRLEQEQADYNAQPDVQQKREEAAQREAAYKQHLEALTQRICELISNPNVRKVSSGLRRLSKEDLAVCHRGGIELRSVPPERETAEDRAAKEAWNNLLLSFGYTPDE